MIETSNMICRLKGDLMGVDSNFPDESGVLEKL